VKIYVFIVAQFLVLKVKMAPAVDRDWDPLSSLKVWL